MLKCYWNSAIVRAFLGAVSNTTDSQRLGTRSLLWLAIMLKTNLGEKVWTLWSMNNISFEIRSRVRKLVRRDDCVSVCAHCRGKKNHVSTMRVDAAEFFKTQTYPGASAASVTLLIVVVPWDTKELQY